MEKQAGVSWVTILVGMFMLVLAVCGYLIWNYLPAPTSQPTVAGPASGPGFEVRYNALVALAQRGSRQTIEPSPAVAAQSIGLLAAPGGFAVSAGTLRADDRLALLLEMLDEARQLRNFAVRLQDGSEQPDLQAAQATVISALHAIAELQRRQPTLDLAVVRPAVEQLTRSSNPVIQQEAVKTKLALDAATARSS